MPHIRTSLTASGKYVEGESDDDVWSTPGNSLQCAPALRLFPPVSANQGWSASNPLTGKRYVLPAIAVEVLLACQTPCSLEDLLSFCITSLKLRNPEILVGQLSDKSLLLPAATPHLWDQETTRLWQSRGWVSALQYVEATHDYPCLDYATEGHTVDKERMLGYLARELEPDRFTRYETATVVRYLPSPQEASSKLAEANSRGTHLSDIEALDVVLGLTFSAVKSLSLSADRDEFILRTSPSGGGRSPTEAYLLSLDPTFGPAGWSHIQASPSQLTVVPAAAVDVDLMTLFPVSVGRTNSRPRALIVLTSKFDRNMYRYREPRTFRTIHMDAGHLVGTAELVAKDAGLQSSFSYSDNAMAIETALSIRPLREGYIATISII